MKDNSDCYENCKMVPLMINGDKRNEANEELLIITLSSGLYI